MAGGSPELSPDRVGLDTDAIMTKGEVVLKPQDDRSDLQAMLAKDAAERESHSNELTASSAALVEGLAVSKSVRKNEGLKENHQRDLRNGLEDSRGQLGAASSIIRMASADRDSSEIGIQQSNQDLTVGDQKKKKKKGGLKGFKTTESAIEAAKAAAAAAEATQERENQQEVLENDAASLSKGQIELDAVRQEQAGKSADQFVSQTGEKKSIQSKADIEEITGKLSELAEDQVYKLDVDQDERKRQVEDLLSRYNINPKQKVLLRSFVSQEREKFLEFRVVEMRATFEELDKSLSKCANLNLSGQNEQNELNKIYNEMGNGVKPSEWQDFVQGYKEKKTALVRAEAMLKDLAQEGGKIAISQESLQEDLQKIYDLHGSKLNEQEWTKIAEQYMTSRNEYRKEAMLESLKKAGSRRALSNFSGKKIGKLSEEAVREDLKDVLKQYSDVQGIQEMGADIQALYCESYELAAIDIVENMSWGKRQLYKAKHFIKKAIGAIFEVQLLPARLLARAIGQEENFNKAVNAVKKGVTVAAKWISKPENLKKVGLLALETGKSILKDFGLVDIAKGLKALAMTPIVQGQALLALAKGEISFKEFGARIGDHAMECLRPVKGLVLMAGELTGATDLIRTVKYALEGNWAMAALHAGFAVVQISACAATIVTGGLAAPLAVAANTLGKAGIKSVGKQIAKKATMEVLEKGIKEASQEVMEEVTKVVTREVLEKTAKEAGENTAKTLVDQVITNGAKSYTRENVQVIAKEVTSEATEKMLRDKGVGDIVEKASSKFLKENIEKKTTRQIAKEMRELGLKRGQAHRAAKNLKKGKVDSDIQEEVIKRIKNDLSEYLEEGMEKPFKNGFKETMEENSEKLAKELGEGWHKSLDDMTEAAWKGAKEGIEEAAERVVREAVRKAFREFRKRYTPNIDDLNSEGAEIAVTQNVIESQFDNGIKDAGNHESDMKKVVNEDCSVKVTYEVSNGVGYKVMSEKDNHGNWIVKSRDPIAEAAIQDEIRKEVEAA